MLRFWWVGPSVIPALAVNSAPDKVVGMARWIAVSAPTSWSAALQPSITLPPPTLTTPSARSSRSSAASSPTAASGVCWLSLVKVALWRRSIACSSSEIRGVSRASVAELTITTRVAPRRSSSSGRDARAPAPWSTRSTGELVWVEITAQLFGEELAQYQLEHPAVAQVLDLIVAVHSGHHRDLPGLPRLVRD